MENNYTDNDLIAGGDVQFLDSAIESMTSLFRSHAPKHTETTSRQLEDDRRRKESRHASGASWGNRWRDSAWFDPEQHPGNNGKVTRHLMRDHLLGNRSLGLVPVDYGGGCWFGALDVDVASFVDGMEEDDWWLERLNKAKAQHCLLPFRSNSGGVHLYHFTKERVSTLAMTFILAKLRDVLGLDSATEIFPKQGTLSPSRNNTGNYINLPLFGAYGDRGLGYFVKGFRYPIIDPDLVGIDSLDHEAITLHIQRGRTIAETQWPRVKSLEERHNVKVKPESLNVNKKQPNLTSLPKADTASNSSMDSKPKSEPQSVDLGGVSGNTALVEKVFNGETFESRAKLEQLQKLTTPATLEALENIVVRSGKRDLWYSFFGLKHQKRGNRHNVIRDIGGYLAGAEPRLTGTMQILNAQLAEPMCERAELKEINDLVDAYENNWRRDAWIRRGDEILANEATFGSVPGGAALVSVKGNEGSNGMIKKDGPIAGGIPLDVFSHSKGFEIPEVLGVEIGRGKDGKTSFVKMRLAWKPPEKDPLWDHDSDSRERGYVEDCIEFPDYVVFSNAGKASNIITNHIHHVAKIKPTRWSSFLAEFGEADLVDIKESEGDIPVALAAGSFLQLCANMAHSGSDGTLIDPHSRRFSIRKIKDMGKCYIIKDIERAYTEFCSELADKGADAHVREVRSYLLGLGKTSAGRRALTRELKDRGVFSHRAHFDNGKSDGTAGQCRCYAIPEFLFSPFQSLHATVGYNPDGTLKKPDPDTPPAVRKAYRDITHLPPPGLEDTVFDRRGGSEYNWSDDEADDERDS